MILTGWYFGKLCNKYQVALIIVTNEYFQLNSLVKSNKLIGSSALLFAEWGSLLNEN